METLYRTMKSGADGRPITGRSARMLGVRVEGPHADVVLDDAGQVLPGRGGMSVTVDDPIQMPPARRPRWLGHGLSEDQLFALPIRAVGGALTVRIDRGAHGLVEPTQPRPLITYEVDLRATRPNWQGIEAQELNR
jgi:hypothetical protein